jgi:hypothetical protein
MFSGLAAVAGEIYMMEKTAKFKAAKRISWWQVVSLLDRKVTCSVLS